MTFTHHTQNPFYENKTTTLVLLYLFTLGLYEHYWHYKSWKIIQKNSGDLSISPLLRGIFYPLFIFSLVSVVKGSAELSNSPQGVARTSFAFIYTVVSILGFVVADTPYAFIFMLSILPLYFLQQKMYQINAVVAADKVTSVNGASRLPNKSLSRLAGLSSRAQSDHRGYLLPNKFMIEFFVFVMVLFVCVSSALNDAEKMSAKAKLAEVMMSASVLKVELAERYALNGGWEQANYDSILGAYGSSIIGHITASKEGDFHFELLDTKPFKQGDILSFSFNKKGYKGPMQINHWRCNDHHKKSGNRTTINEQYLPSICRG